MTWLLCAVAFYPSGVRQKTFGLCQPFLAAKPVYSEMAANTKRAIELSIYKSHVETEVVNYSSSCASSSSSSAPPAPPAPPPP